MKRTLKNLLLNFFATVCRNDGPKVIYYHDVGTIYTKMGTERNLFHEHIAAARSEGFTFVNTVEELLKPRQLLLCFDDGFRGVWEDREWLESDGLHPTVFIAVNLVGRPGYMTWDEILELQKRGFHFEGHTWSHRPLTEVPPNEWKHELEDSRCELSSRLGQTVDSLCFPCGMFSEKIVDAAMTAGYRYLFASYPGCADVANPLLPRNLVQFSSVSEFKNVLHGALCPLRGFYLKQHLKS